jgi:hypothetical protein
MASYNGSCYCEKNDKYDMTCDSFTSSSGYTTYKMLTTPKNMHVDVIGNGDCNEYEEKNTPASSGEECAQNCFAFGHFMASYSGSCYCELNPEFDQTCDSYTDSTGYTTYKMSEVISSNQNDD